jgi:hypothetical protein
VIDVQENEIVVLGICPIAADCRDTDMMARMAEYICRANYGIKNGCFEFDFRDGEIRFRSYIDCEGSMPSLEMIKNCIYCTAVMYKRYAPGIADMIFSGCSAREAVEKCEKDQEDEISSRISEDAEEEMEGTDVEKLIAHVVEELSAAVDEEAEEGTEDSFEEIRRNPFDGKKEGGEAS